MPDPATALHGCEVRTIATAEDMDDAPPCGMPARLFRVPNGNERWICDQHAPRFAPECKPVR